MAGDDLGEWSDYWAEVTAEGRVVQEAAMANPEPADEETEELLAFYAEEVQRRAS